MLIPANCQKYFGRPLEQCFKENFDTVLEDYSKKYMLRASIGGINLFRFVQQNFDDIITALQKQEVSDDYVMFKAKFVDLTASFLRPSVAGFMSAD